MPLPATTGQLRVNIANMEIGDYIKVSIIAANSWSTCLTAKELGYPECALTGATSGNRFFYFIKVAKGILVGDRIIIHSYSWDTMNSQKIVQGLPLTISDHNTSGILRSLTGGVAFADVNGNKSLTEQGYGGWPSNNEWDKYIMNFPKDKISSGKELDDVFHFTRNAQKSTGAYTWCQDTPIVSIAPSTNRVLRSGKYIHGDGIEKIPAPGHGNATSNIGAAYAGFRPVFEYEE
ncbi:hypothetical protein ACQKMD_16735 [Viridibacillus sp. NPDC096237]|uniref:hypothetical protein n=1 Tax=Viridibacillus sp. NPDC096237 TaxID=3390721 RepID=UPI003D02C740